MNPKKTRTDWTRYYKRKKSIFSTFTQKFTCEKILFYFDLLSQSATIHNVIELGGGNSCFANEFCRQRNITHYDIVDNNEFAVSLFEKQTLKCFSHKGILLNLTEELKPNKAYDFVYSIGLIEHFNKEEREKIIKAHFRFCKRGGGVLISFPTPTLKYRFWRKILELSHLWQFHDETPIKYEDVKNIFEKCGRVVKVEMNKKLFLTQMMVLCINEERYENK